MPLSTSSSEPTIRGEAKSGVRLQPWIAYSLICLACFCVLVEVVTRVGFTHISHLESRTAAEHKAALHVIRSSTVPSLLLLGNSLPLEGIDVPQLNAGLGGRTSVTRFVIEQTQYLDWYYGIRRLFRDESKPNIVLLCMDTTHLMSTQTRGEYSAFYLFRLQDIPAVSREAGYNLTQTAGLVLAHYSLFYAGRTSMRNFLLNRVDPAYANLLHNLGSAQGRSAARKPEEKMMAERLIRVRQLCEENGSRFIFLLPPGHGKGEHELLSAGQKTGTTVIVPIHLNAFGPDKFRDGYHLNATGRQIFTQELINRLQTYLNPVS